jgi:predicted nucleic acid-binding protein
MVKTKVYLDNCAYNRPFDDQTQIKVALEAEAKKYIQRLITEKKIDLTYSYINRFENNKSPHPINKNSINAFFQNASVYIDHTHAQNIAERALVIMQSNVKTLDAYHVSSAIEGGCNYFISTDKLLLRYNTTEIIICDPIKFLDYYEEHKDG